MFERLGEIESRYDIVSQKINDADVIADQGQWQKLMKEHASLTPIVEKYREYKRARSLIKKARKC